MGTQDQTLKRHSTCLLLYLNFLLHPVVQLQFLPDETSVLYLLNTTDDNVVESPDETLTVAVYIPGMFPSFLGDLIAVVNIEVKLLYEI